MTYKIAFVGDVMLGRMVNDYLKTAPPEYPWGDTLDVLRSADLRICNLECAVSDRGDPWHYTPKVFHFRTDPKNVASLKAAGINIVSLANNHTLDFGHRALIDTLENLDKAGILRAGAGRDAKEAKAPAIYNLKGLKVVFIAATDNEPGWEARATKPGVFYCPIDVDDSRAADLFEEVRRLKERVAIVIVSLHWGGNWGYEPPPEHKLFARSLIDAGADIIFGHSAHVFRGVEIYRGKPIMYSTGDFIDDYAVDEIERNDESFIFCSEIEDGRISRLKLYPTLIDYMQTKLAGPRGAAVAAKMGRLCRQMNKSALWNNQRQYLEIPITA